jgi:hypothetical protein
MSAHSVHDNHSHRHGTGCGHQAVLHDDHIDYLHDGHLHHIHGDHIDEHALAVTSENPAACTPAHTCKEHETGHRHGTGCGHQAIPHGDHVDYVVGGHLHFAHGSHCDDHGAVRLG